LNGLKPVHGVVHLSINVDIASLKNDVESINIKGLVIDDEHFKIGNSIFSVNASREWLEIFLREFSYLEGNDLLLIDLIVLDFIIFKQQTKVGVFIFNLSVNPLSLKSEEKFRSHSFFRLKVKFTTISLHNAPADN
jgi:hypothetical protein